MFDRGKYQKKNDKGCLIVHPNIYNNIAQQIVEEYGFVEENPEFWDRGAMSGMTEKVYDRQGFDIRARRISKQKYVIELKRDEYPLYYKYRVTMSQQYLGKGTVLVRYGSERGHFTAPYGTAFQQLGLPYLQDTVEFHKYTVLKELCVTCIEIADAQEQQRILEVKSGKRPPDVEYAVEGVTAPAFGSAGGAIQYYHDSSIKKMLGTILEVVE